MRDDRLLEISRNDPELYEKILQYCKDFYKNRIPSDEVMPLGDSSDVTFEPASSWIPGMLSDPKVHDSDYVILKYLQNPNSLILDVGANWGYSAGAFIKLGVKAKIVSFEVIRLFDPVLKVLKDLYPNQYTYFIVGLGENEGCLRFAVPVVNGIANSGLCSAHDAPHLESLAKNIANNINFRKNFGDQLKLRFLEFFAEISTLDKIIPNALPVEFRNKPVEAIKIDVEGLECSVLKGGLNMMTRDRPLVLAEGANRTEGIQAFMESLGYIYAERNENFLVQFEGYGQDSNGFFLHKERLDEYARLGIYRV